MSEDRVEALAIDNDGDVWSRYPGELWELTRRTAGIPGSVTTAALEERWGPVRYFTPASPQEAGFIHGDGCSLCSAPLNRDSSCSKSCAGVGDG